MAASRSSAELEAALAATAQADDPLVRRLRFLELIDKADPSELRRMFQSDQATRREKRSIAQRWAEADAPGLFEFLKGLSRTEWDRDVEQHDAVRGILFRTWALQDADAALAAAASLSNRPQFRNAQWEIVQTLFGSDPAKGFAAAAKLPRYISGDRLVDTLWKNDPAGFLKAAGEAPTAALKNSQIQTAVASAFADLVKQNPSAAAAWMNARSPEQQRRLWSQLASRFAEANLAAAQAWFNEVPPSAQRENVGAEIVNAWAKKDPNAALEWLQDNLQGGRTQAFSYLATALAEKGVDSAKQLLEAMPPGVQRDGVVSAIATKWAQKDFKPAIEWVLSLPPDDPGRRNAMQNLGYQWAAKDLEGAAAYVRDNADREEGRNILWNVTNQFAQKDLAAGVAWAASLPASSQQTAYMSFFQNALTQKTLPGFFTEVEKMPAAQQEAMVGGIAKNMMNTTYSDPDARHPLPQLPQTTPRLAPRPRPPRHRNRRKRRPRLPRTKTNRPAGTEVRPEREDLNRGFQACPRSHREFDLLP